jgi:hypothetical protein
MSKINQQTIISYLQEVVPMMQDSTDPESTLLKYAHDKNMPPSVMERMGHMFNSLKINSSLDHAKTAAERGNFVSTLDVPALLEKYTDISKDIDFDKVSKNQSDNNWWDSLGDGESIAIKTASTQIKQGNIEDLCWKPDIEEGKESLAKYAAYFESQQSENHQEATPESITPEVLLEYKDKASTEAQRLLDLAQKFASERQKIVKKFASYYGSYNAKDYPAFDMIEHGCILNYAKEDIDAFKDSINSLADEIIHSTPYGNMHVKRASEALYKKYVIAKKPDLMEDVVNYHNLRSEEHIAMTMYKKAHQLEDTVVAALFKTSSVVHPDVQRVLDEKKALEERYVRIGQDMLDAMDNYDGNPETNEAYKRLKTESSIVNNILKRIDNLYSDQWKEDEKEEAKLKAEEEQKAKKELEKTINSAHLTGSLINMGGKALSAGAQGLSNAAVGAFTGALMPTKTIIEHASKDTDPVYDKNKDILPELNRLKADTILQEIMWTDPVLSKLDENAIDSVLETYDSAVRLSPELAYNKGLLRNILRRAAEAQGIDPAAAKTISDIHKNRIFE